MTTVAERIETTDTAFALRKALTAAIANVDHEIDRLKRLQTHGGYVLMAECGMVAKRGATGGYVLGSVYSALRDASNFITQKEVERAEADWNGALTDAQRQSGASVKWHGRDGALQNAQHTLSTSLANVERLIREGGHVESAQETAPMFWRERFAAYNAAVLKLRAAGYSADYPSTDSRLEGAEIVACDGCNVIPMKFAQVDDFIAKRPSWRPQRDPRFAVFAGWEAA